MTRVSVNGIYLNVEVTGEGPILLLLHGFTRDHRAWEPVLPCLDGYRAVRVDLIGHGKSDAPPDPSRYTMAHAVEDLEAMLHHLHIDRFGLIGYSLGGRVALHLALEASDSMWAAVFESASPGIEDPVARKARVESDERLAQSIAADGIEAFTDRWQAQPLFASQSSLPASVLDAQKRQRLENSPNGLANSLRGMGAGTQDYLLPRLHTIQAPSLFLAGTLDERYAAAAPIMASTVPGAEFAIIEGAGHTTHLEQPEAWGRLVTGFLAKHRPDTS
ncbi:MAG TPA: 2-succinyl-6-hydroxy-2,4-cyclohexadiene-1-carboxylate synthase [Dehalococcoidia bacterium]|nr:2-succinyl-6-hydroxy-2,4-cyclohexadiene-1-carboxylate synthase [Dehalococcoidia bacterium]